MTTCFFISDLHGSIGRYKKLFELIYREKPSAVFIGGDIFPSGLASLASSISESDEFLADFLIPQFLELKRRMGTSYPAIFVILGNDDGKFDEDKIIDSANLGIWCYVHGCKVKFGAHMVYGYSYVPPTPFMLKDWERYDVSRFLDPGCTPPEGGIHSKKITEDNEKYATILQDLEELTGTDNLENAVFLFHAPPHESMLDRAALDGKMIDYVPIDVHIGSIAIRRFIEERQPLVTLHGHIHESARIMGAWQERFGRTYSFSAAHDGPELALVTFELENLESAARRLV